MALGHRCQRFAGRHGRDSQFAMKYQDDPWCWWPGLGFHRRSAPTVPVRLRAASGQRFVGPDFIKPHQALRLGYGIGTSNTGEGPRISEFVHRWCEISWRVEFTDATPFAVFGFAARGYEQLADGPYSDEKLARLTRVHRAVFRTAYRLMDPPPTDVLSPTWRRLLDAAAAGESVSAEDQVWITNTANAAAGPHRVATGDRDRMAAATFDALHDSRHGGNSRRVAGMYGLAKPTEGQAAEWLTAVGEAIRKRVEHEQHRSTSLS